MFKFPTHCEWCGKELIPQFIFSRFSPFSGGKLFNKVYTCPNRRWYNFIFHDKHFVINGSFGQTKAEYTEFERVIDENATKS